MSDKLWIYKWPGGRIDVSKSQPGFHLHKDEFIEYVPKSRIAELEHRLQVFENIVSESDGVTDYHLNGDVATWDELLNDISEQEVL